MMQGDPVAKASFFRPIQQGLILILLTVVTFGLGAALYSARQILLAVTIGVGLGVLVAPIMGFMRSKLKIPHALGALIIFLIWTAGFAALFYLVYDLVVDHVVPLVQRLPEIGKTVQERVETFLARYPWALQQFQAIDFGGAAGNVSQKLLQGVRVGATAIGGFFFVITIAVYFAVSPRDYVAGFLSLFPAHLRPRTKEVLQRCASNLRRWFGAQLIAMMSVGALTALGLWAIGLDFWLAFGVLTAALDIVPYVGPFLAGFGACVVALAEDPSKVPLVIAIYIVMQNIEGDIIIPLIMRGRIKLPPIQLMTLMLVLASWFGVLGVLVAPPLMTVFRTIYLLLYVPKMDQRLTPSHAAPVGQERSKPSYRSER